MSFNINDTILYGAQGVCKIVEISKQNLGGFGGDQMEYYILKPVYDEKSTIFVPVNNDKLTSKMRHILSSKQIYSLIKNMPDQDTIWIDDDNARREKYKEITLTGDRTQLIKLIKTLFQESKTKKENGKKLHAADERFMKDAEKLLYEEFAHVLKIEPDQVLPFILEQIKVEEKPELN